MPWEVVENESRCPASKPWGVVKQAPDRALEGCHATEDEAKAQQRALYANEPGRSENMTMTEVREATYPFVFERAADGDDGLTLEGYAAVFDTPTHIEDFDGEYDEVVRRGAFTRTLDHRKPVLMFNHGRHPLLGPMPIGAFEELREDDRGLYMRARLFDNWLVWPVRDAIKARAISGASFRFESKRDKVTRGADGTRTRELLEVAVPELGPVVFPAYEDARLIVRSIDTFLDSGLWAPEYAAVEHAPSETRDEPIDTSAELGDATSTEPVGDTGTGPLVIEHPTPSTPESRQRQVREIELARRGITRKG